MYSSAMGNEKNRESESRERERESGVGSLGYARPAPSFTFVNPETFYASSLKNYKYGGEAPYTRTPVHPYTRTPVHSFAGQN